jgi:hypothetical protein
MGGTLMECHVALVVRARAWILGEEVCRARGTLTKLEAGHQPRTRLTNFSKSKRRREDSSTRLINSSAFALTTRRHSNVLTFGNRMHTPQRRLTHRSYSPKAASQSCGVYLCNQRASAPRSWFS